MSNISKRIKALVNEVKFETIADIGTDHAYLPIYAVSIGKIKKAIACDINEKPLERAKINIVNNGYQNIIETRLGSGLNPIKENEVDTVVIAGMGGMMINEILNYSLSITKSLKQLILSPHLDTPNVRKEVHRLGFKIVNETILSDENKFYNIINCEKGEDILYSESDYIIGKVLIKNNSDEFKRFIVYKLNELGKIKKQIENLENKSNFNIYDRLKQIDKLHSIYSEAVK